MQRDSWSTHPGQGAAGHQGACLGYHLHHCHQVRRGGTQADAGDYPSCEVHQGIREVAIVQVDIGPMKPGRDKGRSTPAVPLVPPDREGVPGPLHISQDFPTTPGLWQPTHHLFSWIKNLATCHHYRFLLLVSWAWGAPQVAVLYRA